MKNLLKELEGRLVCLESKEQTELTKARRSEISLVIVRVQQILLKKLNDKR